MERNITRLIEESIEIELNMSRLYHWFSPIFPQEESAGEQHFQEAMEQKAASKALEIFQYLNNEEHDHARRICQYMQQCGMQLSMSNYKNFV